MRDIERVRAREKAIKKEMNGGRRWGCQKRERERERERERVRERERERERKERERNRATERETGSTWSKHKVNNKK